MLRIHVAHPTVLDDLRAALADAECSTTAIGDRTLLVTNPLAVDEREARVELTFFLKAWQGARPDVEAHILE